MCKKNLKGCKMSDVAYLDNAERWTKDMTRMKARGITEAIAGADSNAVRAAKAVVGENEV